MSTKMATMMRTLASVSHPISRRASPTILQSRNLLPSIRTYSSPTSTPPGITAILSKNACPPVGPYSQAILTPTLIFVSGQLPATADGTLIAGTITQKTSACLSALSAILTSANSSLQKIVKVQIFLTDMDDFAEMNREYAKWITHAPARSCVAVKALPKGADIEIECIAVP